MFPKESFNATGVSVSSGVSHQPMTDVETFAGAWNRVMNAKKDGFEADYWIGIEGGVDEIDGMLVAFAWIVILRSDGMCGKARTGTFILPNAVSDLIHQGIELGDADDRIFGRNNSKQANGAVGLLTGDAIDRTNLYEQAIVLALIPFKNPELYN